MSDGAYDITQFGAVGDGSTLNTDSIQKAIDHAAEQGGGIVFVPRGVFLSGTLFLKSGITLEIHPAGRILGSPNLEDYVALDWGQHIDRSPWHLIVANGIHNIKICGGGTIDGNGPAFWEECVAGPDDDATRIVPGTFKQMDPIVCVASRQPDPVKAPISWIRAMKEKRPSPMIEITGCKNVRIQDVNITNSAGWLLHTHHCNFVWIQGVKLTANLMGPNNDGFDITGCHDVTISDCNLSCCDDAICLKTTPDSQTCERITVTNCVIRSKCAALKFGCSESFQDFRQVTMSNCIVHESSRAVALYMRRGATIEDVTISNIVCDTRNPFLANRPIQIDNHAAEPEGKLGKIRNVIISNVVCRTDGRILLTSQAESPLENIVLRDIQMIYPTVDDPELLHADIPCSQLAPGNPDARAARAVLVAEGVTGLVVDNLVVKWPETEADGSVECPSDWKFPVKAVNGGFDLYFDRPQFNADRIPDFHLFWGRNVQGGYFSAPLAKPPSEDVEPCRLEDCQIEIR